jgi:hypothetical protein
LRKKLSPLLGPISHLCVALLISKELTRKEHRALIKRMHRRWLKIARNCDKITAPIEGKPLIHKARKIAWKYTTLSIDKGTYAETYGYGRRIITCYDTCRLTFGVHRLNHRGGNAGNLLSPIAPKAGRKEWQEYFRLRRKPKEDLPIVHRPPDSVPVVFSGPEFRTIIDPHYYQTRLDDDCYLLNQFLIGRRWVTVCKY